MKTYRLTNKNFLEQKVAFIKELGTAFGMGLKEAKEIADLLFEHEGEPKGIFTIPFDVKDEIAFSRVSFKDESYRNRMLEIVIDAIKMNDTVIAESILSFVNNSKEL